MHDRYLLKFEQANDHCWICSDVDGDPGRTTNVDLATRYPSMRLASKNKEALEYLYKRKLSVVLHR